VHQAFLSGPMSARWEEKKISFTHEEQRTSDAWDSIPVTGARHTPRPPHRTGDEALEITSTTVQPLYTPCQASQSICPLGGKILL